MLEKRPVITIANAHQVRQSAIIRDSMVSSLAWSPDGKMLATGSWMNINWQDPPEIRDRLKPCAIRVYKIDELNQPPQQLDGHMHTVGGLVFTPDGKMLVSSAYDRTVRFWDLATGRQQHMLEIPGYSIHSLAISPDGRLLAAGGSEEETDPYDGHGCFIVWDLETGAQQVWQEHEHWIGSVLFSPTGELIAYCDLRSTVYLWDVSRRYQRAVLKGQIGPAEVGLHFSKLHLLVAPNDDYESNLQFWNWETGAHQIIHSLPYTGNPPAFHPDQSMMARIYSEEYGQDMIQLWDWAPIEWTSNLPLYTLEPAPGRVMISVVSFSPDGRILATVDHDAIRLWSVDQSGSEFQSVMELGIA